MPTRRSSREVAAIRASDHARDAPDDQYAWLLDPVSTRTFEEEYYERRLLHVVRDRAGYFDALLSVPQLDTVLGTHRVKHPDVSLVRGEEDLPRSEYADASGTIDPRRVAALFDAGATVVFQQLHRRVPALARLCVAIGRRFGSRVQTNIYLTPPRAQGFVAHWDTHDVFVLQIAGQKRWMIYDTPIPLPLRGQKFDPAEHQPGAMTDQFELSAGSLVYIPRGLMHAAESLDEVSLHVTLGVTAFTWTDFLLQGVSALALDEPSLRRTLPLGFASGELSAVERDRLGREHLQRVIECLDTGPVWAYFRQEASAANTPLYTDLLGDRVAGGALGPASVVARRADMMIEVEHGADTCVMRFGGQELTLPARVRPAVEFAARTARFRVEDLPDCLDAKGKVTLVQRLITEGLLQRGSDEEARR